MSNVTRAIRPSLYSTTFLSLFKTYNTHKTMSLRFCPNISFLFNDIPFANRYEMSKSVGFKAVESGFPYNINLEEVVDAKNKSEVDQILINIYTGDTSKGELGCACFPNMSHTFDEALEKTIVLAKALNCKMIHLMSGKLVEPPTNINDDAYFNNIQRAAKKLEDNNIIGLIEPINPITVPGYYLNDYGKAVAIIKKINSPNLRLMLDIFHLQQICGNISHNLKAFMPYIGHVQIAQVPFRNEPNTPGEINYQYILPLLENCGYSKWVGLEYNFKSGFDWICDYGYKMSA